MTDEQTTIFANLIGRMRGLGVLATPKGVEPGPVVTGYKFSLPDTLPIAKLQARSEDLALAVGVESVDIRRIGHEVFIFVPNKERYIVDFKQALFWYLKDKAVKEAELPILLGTNFRGDFSFLELTDMPHILIAGSTGAGKSVFESAIIASLSTHLAPKELELILVDTKRVDLTLFDQLPHVFRTVKRINEWYTMYNSLFTEVQRRLAELHGAGVRNIKEYNKIFYDYGRNSKRMPYIVVIIDELADLIEHDKAERDAADEWSEPKVIDAIKRLIQICRATGVHIIACTQRTSIDIVSGTVKANFPCRISLRLPTAQDSRTILGVGGAENLLGKGDMLIQRPDKDGLERYHGPFVKLTDIAEIIRDQAFIRQMINQTVQ